MPATTFNRVNDLTRVKNYKPENTYESQFPTGTGWYINRIVRFNDGWEYLHLDYGRWLPVPDDVEIYDA